MLRKSLFLLFALVLAACAAQPASDPSPIPMPTEQPPSATPPTPQPSATPSATPSPLPPTETPPPATPTPGPRPTSGYAPQPEDKRLQRGNLFVEGAAVKVLPGAPAQVLLSLSGSLPSPCHQPRVDVGAPDTGNTLQVSAYSVVDPDQMCIQVLKPFSAEVPLGPLPPGRYRLVINDELTVEFST
jgi:hypothetical protein